MGVAAASITIAAWRDDEVGRRVITARRFLVRRYCNPVGTAANSGPSFANSVQMVSMRLRLLIGLPLAFVLGACSFSGIGEPEADPQPDQNDMRAAYAAIRSAYPGFKLPGNPEVSRVHRVRGGYLAEWAVCVRNDDASQRRYYSFYFKNRKISEWRLSAIVEDCESETFTPLPPA
jgi:hypothetical protein